MTFGLTEQTLALLRAVFQNFPEIDEVRVFGSRALNKYQDHSDIDLAIWGDIDTQALGKLIVELDDLPIAQLFDIQIYNQIVHSDLKAHIAQFGKTLFQRQSSEKIKVKI